MIYVNQLEVFAIWIVKVVLGIQEFECNDYSVQILMKKGDYKMVRYVCDLCNNICSDGTTFILPMKNKETYSNDMSKETHLCDKCRGTIIETILDLTPWSRA